MNIHNIHNKGNKRTMVRVAAAIALLAATVALAAFLGGSMLWVLLGFNSSEIDGLSLITDRPAETMTLGDGWSHYGGDAGGHRYSRADQINRDNLSGLAEAWRFSTGDLVEKASHMGLAAAEGTPILTDDALVFCTPFNEIIALDPATGEERWRFDPEIDLDQQPANQFLCRGVAYWRDSQPAAECARRIFMGTNDSRLIAVDADNGQPCEAFGSQGQVLIEPGIELVWPGEFQFTSPPVVLGDTLVIGSSISDGVRVDAPPGVVRAFDARTGSAKWAWDPIPRLDDDPASSTWLGGEPPTEGLANAWAPLAVDEARGLIFVPTSSPSPDFFGGLRPGDNRYANSVVALEAESGEVRWSFQTVHHDIWDYDLPAQPGLYSVWRSGELHDVVAQVTKTGFVFVLDRDTGEPFLPVEERSVNQTGAAGEWLSPTQPFPVATPGIVPHRLSPDDAFGITWFDRQYCRRVISEARFEGLFTPPSEQGTIVYPFNGGGANWGGAAYDLARNLLIINMSNLFHHIQLIPSARYEEARKVFHDQEVAPQVGAPFSVKRSMPLSPFGIPCVGPPWGVLAAVDLASGQIVWRKPIGDVAGINFGTPTLGGPIVTAGGLVFIASTMDNVLRAFDVATGERLWQAGLPAAGQATPMSYLWEGRQYVVIYAGGHARSGSKLGDSLIAYSLTEYPLAIPNS